MSDPTPSDLAQLADLASLSGFLPELEAQIRKMQDVVTLRALLSIRKGELSGDLAVALWQEFAAQEGLLRSFQTRMGVARAAALRADKALTRLPLPK